MNHLKDETSPYLLQHKDNPVHWMPWGDEAFARARAENKPVFLSIGYTACHWCHVMAHESFEDPATADLMNRHFINIKVDREERPDIDALFQQTLALMGLQGGWPLSMFLTPDGEPFYGGTYFPPEDRHGLPSFSHILRGVADSFAIEPDKIAHNKDILIDALKKGQDMPKGRLLQEQDIANVANHIIKKIDPANGGFGGEPKFPSLPALRLLWDHHIRTGDARFAYAVTFSLTSMCQGGIYDHIGGGFHRYTVDDAWLVPHFEKMLYDNALFIGLLSDVYRETKNPLFRARALETTRFILREMTSHDAFITSIDADSEGVEGKFYTWHEDDIDDALDEKTAALFKKTYDISRFGNWDHVNIPNRLQHRDLLSEDDESTLAQARDILFSIRQNRSAPQKDDKIQADMNGMMIDALCAAAIAFDDDALKEAAQKAYAATQAQLGHADNRLYHSACGGKKGHEAFLDDYAYMIKAALSLYVLTANDNYLLQAQGLAKTVLSHFTDAAGGFFSSTFSTVSTVRLKNLYDLPYPCGNSVMVENLMRLYHLTQDQAYDTALQACLTGFSGKAANDVFAATAFLGALSGALKPLSVEMPHALKDAALSIYIPQAIYKNGKEPHALVCVGSTCLAPVSDKNNLLRILREKRQRSSANDG